MHRDRDTEQKNRNKIEYFFNFYGFFFFFLLGKVGLFSPKKAISECPKQPPSPSLHSHSPKKVDNSTTVSCSCVSAPIRQRMSKQKLAAKPTENEHLPRLSLYKKKIYI